MTACSIVLRWKWLKLVADAAIRGREVEILLGHRTFGWMPVTHAEAVRYVMNGYQARMRPNKYTKTNA